MERARRNVDHVRRALAVCMLLLGQAWAVGCGGDAMPVPASSPSATVTLTATVTPTSVASSTPPPPPTATATPVLPSPTATRVALCAERVGGALITFALCGETLTVWSTARPFIDEAIALQAGGAHRIPVFGALLDGADCDARWTWHPDPAAMSFADLAIELCDGCPSHIENDKAYWLGTVHQYCPWTATVVAVDDRRGAP